MNEFADPERAGVTELLAQVGDRASVRLSERLTEFDLTPAKLRALRVIEQRPELSQQALAFRLGIAASRVAKLVEELEAQGLVERRRRTTDRRRSALQVTAGAQERLAAAREAIRALDCELTRTLTAEELGAAESVLAKLARAIGADHSR